MTADGAQGQPLRTLDQAARYLEGLIDMERVPALGGAAARGRLGLGPIQRLLERLGHPEKGLSVLHVAGSKGKGSVCLLAEQVLRACGERVGTFTSPHLSSWTERFRIDGEPVVGEELARAVEQLRPHVDELRARDPGDAPTFFDATTAAALLIFARAGVDRAILEVGLGGRLDSTNAVVPAVTCVTQIELEHTEILGDTLAAIAAEKAGILKPGAACVVGWLEAEALAVVRARALEVGAPLFEAGRDFELVRADPDALGLASSIEYREPDGFAVSSQLELAGRHQARNAALALACVRRLPRRVGDAGLAAAADEAFRSARLPGRVEVLGRSPWLVVDAAHTAASARALQAALAALPAHRRHLVLSVSAGKDLGALLRALLPSLESVTATRADPHRSLDPELLAAEIRRAAPGLEVVVEPDARRAVRSAREALGADDLLCAAGSVYLAGIAREELGAAQ